MYILLLTVYYLTLQFKFFFIYLLKNTPSYYYKCTILRAANISGSVKLLVAIYSYFFFRIELIFSTKTKKLIKFENIARVEN